MTWIKHIIEVLSPNKWDTNKKRVGYSMYHVNNNLWNDSGEYDLLNVEFYVKKKESPLEILEDRLFTKQFELTEAKRKFEQAQKRAARMLELCGVIETDIGIIEDEIEEINLLIAKNYPNDPR